MSYKIVILLTRIASTEGDLSEETFQNIISTISENDVNLPTDNGMIELILFVANSEIIITIGIFYNYIEQDEAESESEYVCSNQTFVSSYILFMHACRSREWKYCRKLKW